MKQQHLFSLLDTTSVTIRVVFPRDVERQEQEFSANAIQKRFNDNTLKAQLRSYCYKAPIEAGVKVDDLVVIDSPRGMTVAKVVQVDTSAQIDVDADFDYKFIVQKVDTSDYERRTAREASFGGMMLEVERTRQREALVADMRQHLPAGSEALKLFEAATAMVALPAAPVQPPEGFAPRAGVQAPPGYDNPDGPTAA